MEEVRSVEFVAKAIFYWEIYSEKFKISFLKKGKIVCFPTKKSAARVAL